MKTSEPRGERVADESVVVRRVRTTEPYRSEGTLLYLGSFDGGEAGENEKSFHKAADRVGHLFQGRYRSILVDKENYLLELSRYIHLNPVRARMVKEPEAYRWSSYSSYLSPKFSPEWLRSEDVLGQMDNNLAKGRRKYRQFVEEGLRREIRDPLKEVIAGIALGGERFWEGVRKRLEELRGGSEFPELREVRRRTDVRVIVERVASFYGISDQRITQRGHPIHPGSQVAMYLTRKKTDLSLNDIAAFFGGRHYTAVSAAFKRIEARRQQDPRLDRELSKIEKAVS